MILPGIVFVIVFHYIPMAGITIAFQKFIPAKGLFGNQEWVGLENFKFAFQLQETWRVVRNTIIIAGAKIFFNLTVPLIVALMLNELRNVFFKRSVQTLIFLPYFISWVLLAAIFIDMLSIRGMINGLLEIFGVEPLFFLGSNAWFRWVLIFSDTWKEFGYISIIYLAALTAIDPTLYESAVIDGANRWKQTLHITLPGVTAVVVLLAVLNLGNVLNAGFDQVFNLYNPIVYETGDIIDTLVYRMGLVNAQYSLSTTIGVMKSAVSCILIAVSYFLASKFANYRIF